jgi:large subunit ribosomal protein L15
LSNEKGFQIMAIGLNNLKAPPGATHKKKRVGRGPGSGLGKTSGRGNKGQKSRSGYSGMRGFEGGQMPLHRRLPKRGFTNLFKREWAEVNLADLEKMFDAGATVTPESLVERGLIRKSLQKSVVILGQGELKKALNISAHRFSKSAREKIEAAGGKAEAIEDRRSKVEGRK